MTKWLLIIGAGLGLVATLLVNLYIRQIEARQQSEVFIRVRDEVNLPRGAVLEPEMLESVAVPEEFGPLARIAVADTLVNREWVLGRRVVQEIKGGQFLRHDHLLDLPDQRFAGQIGNSMRAISIPVDRATAVGFFIGPGSHVDLIGTFRERRPLTRNTDNDLNPNLAGAVEDRIVTRTILQNVRVLAVGNADTWAQYQTIREEGYSTVTLELSLAQVEQLVFARTQLEGPLTLVLRNPGDDGTVETPSVSWESLR